MDKIKKLLINLLCMFIPSKPLRKKVRNKLNGTDIIKTLNHKHYGKIYLPLYNLEYAQSEEEPEIYNEDGERMRTFFIRDLQCAQSPLGIKSKYFLTDRFNFGLKTHFYSHQAMLETMGNPDKKFGFLFESMAIVPEDYKIFDKHKGLNKDFDLIFTYDEKILNKYDNAVFVPFCANVWYGTFGGGERNPEVYKNKSKNISICSSDKTQCELHVVRLNLAKKLKKENLADTFGTFDGGSFINIADTLTDYRYSFAIENIIEPYFFTERLLNCFASMTIPIYIGANKIDEFFNPDGIIKVSVKDLDNIENIIKQCTKEEYEARIPAIIDNYNRVQSYYNNRWDDLYQKYFK